MFGDEYFVAESSEGYPVWNEPWEDEYMLITQYLRKQMNSGPWLLLVDRDFEKERWEPDFW